MNYLNHAKSIWNLGACLRSRRSRLKRYTFGDQWGDIVLDNNGIPIPERELLNRINHHPATNNIIRQLVKTVVGCYRTRRSVESDKEYGELDARTFEEFLISGCAIHRVSRHVDESGCSVHVEQVNPTRFFIDMTHDGQTEFLGELHDMTLRQIVMRHSHGSRQKASRIKRIYEGAGSHLDYTSSAMLGESANDSVSFSSAPEGRQRLIEIWNFETRERLRCHDPRSGKFYYAGIHELPSINAENKRRAKLKHAEIKTRWEMTGEWHCRFMSPSGEVIDEYTADTHPYIYKFYPLIDGEIHSFVEDLIEHQRNINRLLTLNDRVLSTAAKGVLLFPDNQKSPYMSLSDTAQNWAAPDGIVIYRAIPGLPGPQQIVSSTSDLGINGMVEQQLRLIEEISGVGGALKGTTPSSSKAASYYESQRESSLTALADLFESFESFTQKRDTILKRMTAPTQQTP